MQNTANMSGASGQNFGEKEDFKLEEKVTAESEGIRLLCIYINYIITIIEQGYLQSYVDFFYITTDTTPSEIQPSIKLKEE
jgi:hypothetical protein